VLVITDLNGARSVTNDAESVLADCCASYGAALPPIAIYRDTLGRYDQLLHLDGDFLGFALIGETDRARAIAKAVAYGPSPPRRLATPAKPRGPS
jgi:hypothetical protein